MAVPVYWQPVRKYHYAPTCSSALLLQIVSFAFLVIMPYLAAYRSQGFWIKEAQYREQAEVHYTRQLLLVVEGDGSAESYAVFSTFARYNDLMQDYLIMPQIRSYEEDRNHDGLNDRLKISVTFSTTFSVKSVKALLFFDYKLHEYVDLHMQSLAYFEHSSPLAGSGLAAFGDLKFQQRNPLPHSGSRTVYNTEIIDGSGTTITDYELSTILSSYAERNETTYFEARYPTWKSGPSSTQSFQLDLIVNYPEERIFYRPGFWQEVKYAWIQYLALLIPMWYLVGMLKAYAFQNQVVVSLVRYEEKPKNS